MKWSTVLLEVLKAAGTVGLGLFKGFKKPEPVKREEFRDEIEATKRRAEVIEDGWRKHFDKKDVN